MTDIRRGEGREEGGRQKYRRREKGRQGGGERDRSIGWKVEGKEGRSIREGRD